MGNVFENALGVNSDYGVFMGVVLILLIVPFNLFYLLKDYFEQYYSPQNSEIYSAASCVGFVWLMIMFYIIYFFKDDLAYVFLGIGRNDQFTEENIKEGEKVKQHNALKNKANSNKKKAD